MMMPSPATSQASASVATEPSPTASQEESQLAELAKRALRGTSPVVRSGRLWHRKKIIVPETDTSETEPDSSPVRNQEMAPTDAGQEILATPMGSSEEFGSAPSSPEKRRKESPGKGRGKTSTRVLASSSITIDGDALGTIKGLSAPARAVVDRVPKNLGRRWTANESGYAGSSGSSASAVIRRSARLVKTASQEAAGRSQEAAEGSQEAAKGSQEAGGSQEAEESEAEQEAIEISHDED